MLVLAPDVDVQWLVKQMRKLRKMRALLKKPLLLHMTVC
jgi:hypothetical protein